jgi:hypothetical protein
LLRSSSKPQYEAVSYVRGNATQPKIPIEVAGEMFDVSKNLHDALRQLRLPDTPRTLWIDQICIRQWDLAEKASQVRLMREIYSGCSRCLAWLGEIKRDVAPYSDTVVGFLAYLLKMGDADDAEQVPVPPFMADLKTFEGPIAALRSLAEGGNPWWMRIWTVQEVVLPPVVCIVWGHLYITWETLVGAGRAWVSNSTHAIERLYTKSNNQVIASLLSQVLWLETERTVVGDPLDISMKWRFRGATDPRDKVYALLGLQFNVELQTMRRCDYTGT